MTNPPIIIIGMHRSGTTMLTEMLNTLGVFVGKDRDYNCESSYVRAQNDWAIETSGGAWDHPLPILPMLSDQTLLLATAAYFERRMTAVASRAYWGGGPFYRSARRKLSSGAWGWKDPRNTFTLPIWLRVYPDAKILHIYRHGVDVAASLSRREQSSRAQRLNDFAKRKSLYYFYPRRGGFSGSYRCANIDRAFSLWVEYMDQVRRLDADLPGRIVHVRYENLLHDPLESLRVVVERLNVPCASEAVTTAAGSANTDRCYAYLRDADLCLSAERWEKELTAWGYSANGEALAQQARVALD